MIKLLINGQALSIVTPVVVAGTDECRFWKCIWKS